MNNICGLGGMSDKPHLTKFVPSYYNDALENQILFVDVNTFFKIDNRYLECIILESTGDKILSVKNSSSIFLVNIDGELEKLLIELFFNTEAKFQYQVEQEEVPDDVTVYDQPKDKPSKTSGNGPGSYKRDYNTAKKAIVLAKYMCEINPSHEDFISRVSKENYVEANIVSLCVGCHKKLHHATCTVIEPLIEKLYNDSLDRLKDCDINITKERLLDYYK